ncbi:GFA family protein [Rhizobium leguminosarum]|uniref:GFA family protein n=1 Tax=Rhizobium leguminosarum TaxID=384 RepID=UPI001C929C19|nr:GFA family protein [Rhizobium leguminosarum]MBY2910730.1 aldehyde-activating protein [Rhizobium leguminosarum]
MPIFHAQCTCGALALEVDGDPVHNHVCTCTRCQRASGSALSHNVWFREENVRIISGEYSVWFPQGETTPEVMKAFCGVCGGGGFSKSGTYFPGTVVIAGGTFADPSFPVPDHVHWWDNRPHWLDLAEPIERLAGN